MKINLIQACVVVGTRHSDDVMSVAKQMRLNLASTDAQLDGQPLQQFPVSVAPFPGTHCLALTSAQFTALFFTLRIAALNAYTNICCCVWHS